MEGRYAHFKEQGQAIQEQNKQKVIQVSQDSRNFPT
jgi:hypothetical protein